MGEQLNAVVAEIMHHNEEGNKRAKERAEKAEMERLKRDFGL